MLLSTGKHPNRKMSYSLVTAGFGLEATVNHCEFDVKSKRPMVLSFSSLKMPSLRCLGCSGPNCVSELTIYDQLIDAESYVSQLQYFCQH